MVGKGAESRFPQREHTSLVKLQQDPEYENEWFSQYGDLSNDKNGELTLKQLYFPLTTRTKKNSGGDHCGQFLVSFESWFLAFTVKELFDPNFRHTMRILNIISHPRLLCLFETRLPNCRRRASSNLIRQNSLEKKDYITRFNKMDSFIVCKKNAFPVCTG